MMPDRITLGLAVVTCTLASWAVPVQAGFIYSDFSSVAGLTLNGAAAQVGNVLRVTPSAPSQGGSVFTTAALPLGALNSFSTYFKFRMSNSGGIGDGDGQGADGLVFVIQTVNNSVGGIGGGIGYQGISPSVGVEFDTFDNGLGAGDPNGNHVAIDINGDLSTPLSVVTEAARFNNGSVWNVWVDYNGITNELEGRWSLAAIRPALSQISASVNLLSVLGQNTAFIGFTSGTGAGFNDHDILSWEYRDAFDPINTVPEPSGLAIWAIGACCVALRGFMGKRRDRC